MSGEDFLDIPKTDETQQSTPEEMYFSRSKNEWLHVSDMSDMHVRRAFKRLLRMIRLGTLIELSDDKSNMYGLNLFYDNDFDNPNNPGQAMAEKIKQKYWFSNIVIPDVYHCKDLSDYIARFNSYGGMATLIEMTIYGKIHRNDIQTEETNHANTTQKRKQES